MNETKPKTYSLEEIPYYRDPDDESVSELEWQVIEALQSVFDPEIPVNIYELGLIYQVDIKIHETLAYVNIAMTLTAPGCPVAGSMPEWVENAVRKIDRVEECQVDLVWDPPWRMEMMSLRAKIELNMI